MYDYRDSNYHIQDWYRIVEGFSTNFVEEKLKQHHITYGKTVLDPHSGSGTTALVCKYQGIDSVSIDANPWCYLVTKCKTDWNIDITEFDNVKNKIIGNLPRKVLEQENITGFTFMGDKQTKLFSSMKESLSGNPLMDKIPLPLLPRIDRKMSEPILNKVLHLKKIITETIEQYQRKKIRESTTRLLWFAFGAKLMNISNMTWHGPKVTWRKRPFYNAPVFVLYEKLLTDISRDLRNAQALVKRKSKSKIILGDSRHVDKYIQDSKIDLAITSPPYMNEACYCDQSQFQLFFLDFVKDMGDLKEVKKRMLTCNTKYIFKDSNNSSVVEDYGPVMEIYERMKKNEKRDEKNWGWNRPKMLIEYFGGMKMHIASMYNVLREGASYSIIIGDSAIAGVHIPTDTLIEDLGRKAGFSRTSLDVFRRRQSSRHRTELRESVVTLTK